MRQPVPFGKYLLLDRISVGGMAEVFKAKSYGVEGFEKIIAIKRILPTMGEDRDFIKMFIDEAKIAGQLAHANICQIFELGRIDGSHFIAMEYIWGKDLLQIQNRLRKIKQGMPVSMACFSIAKVLEGLDYAHRKRDPLGRPLEIVHRDCSPQNVLVSYEGEVKVIDFGIAKATSRNSRTMAGVLKGKFGYMSPEQVRGLPLDRRSDIFALGTMLYECLTGERLFQGETDFSTLEKVRNVDIRPPRELNPQIPEAVERVILKALAKDVDERYQWCSEMLADLQAYLMSQDVVFTAKSLSGWLKEVFSTEIDKERQQLEQYKRVGRDGLIAGLPAAEAKMDVVENLGEAGPVEGDPTMLGSPNFDDLESAMAASAAPEVGPAPGSPAARGAQARAASSRDEDGDSGDFGEEAPTEIFGEIDHGGKPGQPVAPAQAQPQPRAPSGSQPAQSRPPKPPPSGRAPTVQPPMYGQPGMAASPGGQPQRAQMPMAQAAPQNNGDSTVNLSEADLVPSNSGAPNNYGQSSYPQFAQPSPQAGFPAQGYANPQSGPHGQQSYSNPYGQQNGSQPVPMPVGTPGSMPVSQPINALAAPGQPQGKTLMGAAPPPGLPNYSQGYPPSLTGPQAAQGYPQQYPQQGYPQASPYGSGPMPNMMPGQHAYGGQSGAYQMQPSAAVEQLAPSVEGKKRSSIGRDVAIGVAIAALVLGGFLAVKFLVLDAGDGKSADTGGATSSIATIKLTLPAGVSADLFVDDKKIATVSDKQEIPVTAGQRKVKLIGPNGARCEQELKLPAGKTTPLECVMYVNPSGAGSAATGTGSASAGSAAAGSASAGSAAAGSASAGSAAGSGSNASISSGGNTVIAGAGSAKPTDKTVDVIDPKQPGTKPVETKPADPKPADKITKPIEVAKVDPKPADKVIKPADPKPVDKVTKPADPKPADKLPKPVDKVVKPTDKMPAEDKTAKQAVASDKGYLQLYSKPSAKISVDTVDTGLSTPITGRALSLTPGKHKITFTIGNDKFTFAVNIKAGATETLSKDLQ